MLRGGKLPLPDRYVTSYLVTEVSAIRFLTEHFQYSLIQNFQGPGIRVCYQFVEIVHLIFSVGKAYLNKITNFHKV